MTLPRRLLPLPLILILFLATSVPAAARDQGLLRHLQFLASDELKGRGNTMPELELAARYIADEFRKCGLIPAGAEEGSYFQPFPLTAGHRLETSSRVRLLSGEADLELQINDDYVPLTYGAGAQATGSLVFAGFGITAPEWGYDDYAGISVQGKLVLVLDGEPRGESSRSPFQRFRPTPFSSRMHKILNAKHRGAAGVLIVASSRRALLDQIRLETLKIEDTGIHTLLLAPEWGDQLISEAGRRPEEVRRWLNDQMTPYSFEIPDRQGEVHLQVTPIRHMINNVIGYLPGTVPEYIVLGAHYDHLGLGDQSSLDPNQLGQIHNGADDNASGTSGLIELSCELASLPLQKGLLFAAFAGEELGLLGSRYYTRNPTLPLDQAVAMLNLDMIGRSRGDVIIGGVGSTPAFRPILDEIQQNSPLVFRYSDSVRGSSDHQSFADRRVPNLFFFSGLHSDYHKPSDQWEKIELVRLMQILDVVRETVLRLDATEESLQFVDTAVPGRRAGSGSQGGPFFGSLIDMAWEDKGVRFAEIQSGSPAEAAGLKAGDVLVQFDGKQVDNLYDFTFLLRSRQSGDQVDVTVLRGDTAVQVQVRLGSR